MFATVIVPNMTDAVHTAMWQTRKILWPMLMVMTAVAVALGAWWLLLYDNYHEVIPGELYRSGQVLSARLSRRAERDQIATVINLRPDTNETWYALEVGTCRQRGTQHIDFPMRGDQPPTLDQMRDLVGVMERSERPLLIHCEHGADRTGLAVALYMKAVKNRSAEEAAEALSLRYGHLPLMREFDRAFHKYCEE